MLEASIGTTSPFLQSVDTYIEKKKKKIQGRVKQYTQPRKSN
jgi:hypothetical protein